MLRDAFLVGIHWRSVVGLLAVAVVWCLGRGPVRAAGVVRDAHTLLWGTQSPLRTRAARARLAPALVGIGGMWGSFYA